jgi:IS1 family transposase
MPARCTTSWSRFPPQTLEVQFDEKWSFVGKKEKHCDPADPDDAKQGDAWDHVALDSEHRLVVSVVPGKRTAEKAEAVVQDFQKRTGGRPMNLITSDEYKPYRGAILKAYGKRVVPRRTGKPGRPKAPYDKPSPALKYATVHKTRHQGRVVKIDFRVVFGTETAVRAALKRSKVSKHINTAFVERQNGTDRNRNGRKVRKTYGFSKDWDVHDAVTYFTIYTYNFCWPVRTLRHRGPYNQRLPKPPAMAAGLTDHVWSLREWLTLPAVQRV